MFPAATRCFSLFREFSVSFSEAASAPGNPLVEVGRGGGSGRRFLAEMDRNPALFIVEHGNELEPSTDRFEVVLKRRDSYVFGVFDFRHVALGDFKPPRDIDLTECVRASALVEPDFLLVLGARPLQGFRRAGPADHLVAEIGPLVMPTHSMNPSSRSSFRYSS